MAVLHVAERVRALPGSEGEAQERLARVASGESSAASGGRNNSITQRVPEHSSTGRAVDLWREYIRGYLSGFMAPENQPIRAVVVRQENILHRPPEVVEALQGLVL